MFKKKVKQNADRFNPNEACSTCCHVLEESKPILYIRRDGTHGGYQFLCGAEHHTETEKRVVELGEIAARDHEIEKILPLQPDVEIERQYISGKGLELKKFIQDGIQKIIQQDINDNKLLAKQLSMGGEIIYENGRNGTWFDWTINEHTSYFTVRYKNGMCYLKVAVYHNGAIDGYKWGNKGKDEAIMFSLGTLSIEDTEYLLRTLLQQAEDTDLPDASIDTINWDVPIYLEPLDYIEDDDE